MADIETKTADQAPRVAGAPETLEDPSRGSVVAAQSFPGFPKAKYHPVKGKRMINDPNEEHGLPGPAHNWFDTAEEADMHRTDADAQQAIHNNHRVKVDAGLGAAANDGDHGLAPEVVNGDAGVVRGSVAATESLKSGVAEPL